MRYLSLFSGIEAATVAWHPLGWEPVAFSEIEPFPCALLQHHYPDVPNLGDVTKITEEQIKQLGPIDLVVFGAPCQDLSIAGKQRGFRDEDGNTTRSGLFFDALRIFGYARKHGNARFALWENVPGAFSSSKGRDFAEVVAAMAGLEHVDVPKNGWGSEGAAVGDNGLLEWLALMHNGVGWRSGATACSLSSILETGSVGRRYFLSAKACAGILRRAEKRGKKLPEMLRKALLNVVELESTDAAAAAALLDELEPTSETDVKPLLLDLL